MPLISADEASKRLSVNAQRVRALASQGRLPAVKVANRWMFESDLLHDYAARRRSNGRPFRPSHALGLLYLASGEDAPWLAEYDKWRLRRYVARLLSIAPRLRSRAKLLSFRAPDSVLQRLRDDKDLILSGVSAAERYGADIAAPAVVEAYGPSAYVQRMAHRYAFRLVPEASANLLVHEVDPKIDLGRRDVMPMGVVALDLYDSVDGRTRRAGEAMIRGLPAR